LFLSIYKEPKYLDYVIVHELSHFIHPNHGKGFWKLVEENEPNYKRLRKELQE
jgi:predicted metal-dependent hydrolase